MKYLAISVLIVMNKYSILYTNYYIFSYQCSVWFGYCFKPCGLFNLISLLYTKRNQKSSVLFYIFTIRYKVLYNISYRLYNIFSMSHAIYYINYIILHEITQSKMK